MFLRRLPFLLLLFPVCVFAQLKPSAKDPLQPPQGIQGTGACSATEVSSCAEAAAKILPQVMGDSPMAENLRRLTDEVGGRVTGTPQMARAVEWGVAGFRAAGVDVHTEKYTLPVTWSEGETRLELIGPAQFPVRLASTGWSPATPIGGIEANVIDIGGGSEEEFARGNIKGSILLVHSEIGTNWADLFDEYLRPPGIIERAVKSGAGAILWMGARERLLMYRHTNTLDGRVDKIPQAVVAREDAMRLARAIAAHPGQVRGRFNMPNKIGGPIEQENVVAEIRGREKPDETVILAAHLDSWEFGTGALDNGCNAALVVEAARAIHATGLLPRRTIRFILFSGEEQGTVGSFGYVKAHRAEIEKLRAVIVFDTGSGRVTGYSLGGRRDIEAGIRAILKPLDSWGATNHTTDASFGTDNFDFLLEGVPTLVANQEISNYLVNYHAASDTFDKVDLRELKLNTAIAALTAWGAADRAEPLGKRFSRSEMDALVKETGLDQQMKVLGYWDAWQSGERGRKP
ncbi:MAG TPA: M20/M25/M40 family metallo-hydrolase [Candidatus Dormibacteraeota bacterium]|jgi:carboxypeptidase Q|nr:M20/M25/M40 family metallo-hydrolase [Candidatus Dormibacteraeota bacterium]